MKKRNSLRIALACVCLIFLAILPIVVSVRSQANRTSGTSSTQSRSSQVSAVNLRTGPDETKHKCIEEGLATKIDLVGTATPTVDEVTGETVIKLSNSADTMAVLYVVSDCSVKMLSVVPPPKRVTDELRPPVVLAVSKDSFSAKKEKEIDALERLRKKLQPVLQAFNLKAGINRDDKDNQKLEIKAVLPDLAQDDLNKIQDDLKNIKKAIANIASKIGGKDFDANSQGGSGRN